MSDGLVVAGVGAIVCSIAIFALALRPATFRDARRDVAAPPFDDPTWTRTKRFRRRHARAIRELREALRGPVFVVVVAFTCSAVAFALVFGK